MDKIMLHSVQFGDGTLSISYMDTARDLREGGDVYTTHNVSLGAKNKGLWSQAQDIRNAVLELLEDVQGVYDNSRPWTPDPEDEDDDDECMGGHR